MERLIQKFYEKYAATQTETVRDIIHKIDWTNRFVGIKGSRGVGKTTLILQYIKLNYKADNTVLYVSLDNLYFTENNLYDLADQFYKKGGKLLAIDEVHRYRNWAIELKNIYDDMPELKVVFTVSSLLHLYKAKADLSRRAVMYNMPGLSFREFINFETGSSYKEISFEEILENHVEMAMEISKNIKPLEYFDKYLRYGYYPFYRENIDSFNQKLSEIVLTILEVDIPQFASMPASNIFYLKKLLRIISISVPFKPNMNSLSERTGISLNTMKVYIKYLYDAQLLNLLYVDDKGINSLNKPEKIYLDNSNLMYSQVGEETNIGNARETFLFNQLDIGNTVYNSATSDFLINNKFTIEVGGRSKGKKQISKLKDAYIAMDGIEIGSSNSIPLWLFGMVY
ncbi:MAG: AAA family ATPase [Marinilabiliales bacterium]|nr:MAG: AAA family ATPase [Marinilabiliales bacterium]